MNMSKWISVGILSLGGVAVSMSMRQSKADCCSGMSAAATSQPASQPTSGPSAGKVVNTRCPIMGGAIDPAKVPANLTREYKGQKVGFCCGGCPASWDKLSAAEKDAKLKAVLAK